MPASQISPHGSCLRIGAIAAAVVCALVFGCARRSAPTPDAGPPEVEVSRPLLVQEVTDYEDFTGKIEAKESVELRARVGGYLVSGLKGVGDMNREGAEVKRGDLLFQIDPSTYQADADKAEANLHQAEAHLKRLQRDYDRALPLLQNNTVSREDFDRISGDRDEATAAVRQANAVFRLAKRNLEFTEIRAPFDGLVGRQNIDVGNLVKADDTVLTTIVWLDPIYATFDVDERTTLRIRRAIREGKIKSARESKIPVHVGLVDELDKDGKPLFPHEGIINFVDNRLDPLSSTLRLRAQLSNPRASGPNRLFAPGNFARVRVQVGQPREAVLIAEQALKPDQGQSFVYVVKERKDDQGEVKQVVESRCVVVGARHYGLLAVKNDEMKPEDRLTPQDWIVVKGLQRVRPQAEITAKQVEMPLVPGNSPPPLVKTTGQTAGGRPSS